MIFLPSHEPSFVVIWKSCDAMSWGIKMALYPWHMPIDIDTEWAHTDANAWKKLYIMYSRLQNYSLGGGWC